MDYPYSTSTVDARECKCLFSGRLNDLTQLLDYVAHGQSVALFGERRIGKTLLLFLLRDILNGEIVHYESDLLDGTLKAGLAALRGKVKNCTAVCVSLHDLAGSDAMTLRALLLRRLQAHGFLRPSAVVTGQGQPVRPLVESADLPGLFASLNGELQERRVLLLFDEVEVLLDDRFENAAQVFRQLRSVIQTYPALSFVFAGAEDWHTRIKDRTSPLVGNVKTFYLKAAAPADIENHLLGIPLRQALPETNLPLIIRQVLAWTGSKPYYVQAIGTRIVSMQESIDQWRDNVKPQVHQDTEPQLVDFYDNINEVAKKILVLLAHQPGLTVNGMARRLGLSRQTVWDRVSDLEALDKVRRESGEYHIVGTLVAEWGQKNRNLPIPSPWPKRIKLIGTLIALAAAVWIFLYTHPPHRAERFAFSVGTVRLMFPSSVETGEQGTLEVAVQNTGKTIIPELSFTLSSDQAHFRKDESSRLSVKPLNGGETKHFTMVYSVHPESTGGAITVRAAVESIEPSVSDQFTTALKLRRFPLQRWWALISPSLLILAAALQQDVIKQLVTSLGSIIVGRQETSEKKDT